MPTIHTTRQTSVDEIAAEMDRRGTVIEAVEAERDAILNMTSLDLLELLSNLLEAEQERMEEAHEDALDEAMRSQL